LLSPIADPEHVNERRLAIGMNTIEERTRELNADQQPEQITSEQFAEYQSGYLAWLRQFGWRRGTHLLLSFPRPMRLTAAWIQSPDSEKSPQRSHWLPSQAGLVWRSCSPTTLGDTPTNWTRLS